MSGWAARGVTGVELLGAGIGDAVAGVELLGTVIGGPMMIGVLDTRGPILGKSW